MCSLPAPSPQHRVRAFQFQEQPEWKRCQKGPCLSPCDAVCPSLCRAVCPSLCRAVCPSLCRAVCPSLGRAVCPSLCRAVCPSLCRAVCPSLGSRGWLQRPLARCWQHKEMLLQLPDVQQHCSLPWGWATSSVSPSQGPAQAQQ
uniref:Uncharacterized protein n=1 Tax=Cyanistes caeruleus TaxID=156563 RepID=A0A8C0VE94_CYACU